MYNLYYLFFKKPSLAELISPEILDKPLRDEELVRIALKCLMNWETKAPAFGLSETDVENIDVDYRYNEEKKIAMMRRWKKIYGDKATLRELISISEKNGYKLAKKACKELGFSSKQGSYNIITSLVSKKGCGMSLFPYD